MGATPQGRTLWLVAGFLLIGAVLAACTDNEGPAGPGFPAGHALDAGAVVSVTASSGSVPVGASTAVVIRVTSGGGGALGGRHVSLNATGNGVLAHAEGFTGSDGRFTTSLLCTAGGGVSITAFSEGAFGTTGVNCL